MDALSPVRQALRPCGMNTFPYDGQVSLIHVSGLLIPPSPLTEPAATSLLHATPQLIALPILGLGFAILAQAHRTSRSGRIEFVILRMDHSLSVASHLTLRQRNYLQLQAGERMPEEDFHFPVQTRFQAHASIPIGM